MRRALVAVSTLVLALGLTVPGPAVAVASILGPSDQFAAAAVATPDEPVEPPPVTVNPFMPTDRSLSECLSAVQRPGCGSEARGGLHQTAVFGAILLGLGIIGTRIVIGVRRGRPSDVPPSPESTSTGSV